MLAPEESMFPTSPLLGSPLAVRANNYEERKRIAELERKRDWSGLLRFAQEKQRLEPERPDWWIVSGYAWLAGGDYPRAIDILNRATQRSPEDTDAWNLLGETQRLSGQAGRAVQTLERASTMSRASRHITLFLLGEAYRDVRRPDRAIGAYREALQIEPQYAPAWYGVGNVYAQTGDRKQAQAALEELKKLDPGLAQLLAARIQAGGR